MSKYQKLLGVNEKFKKVIFYLVLGNLKNSSEFLIAHRVNLFLNYLLENDFEIFQTITKLSKKYRIPLKKDTHLGRHRTRIRNAMVAAPITLANLGNQHVKTTGQYLGSASSVKQVSPRAVDQFFSKLKLESLAIKND